MDLYIEEWEWDDGNIEHLARHGITPELIEDEIWAEAPKYNANRQGRSASHFMIGPDRGGMLWTICILQVVDDPATLESNHRLAKQTSRRRVVLEGTMSKRRISEEQANELEQQSEEDTELWTQEPVQIEARPSRTSVLSLRLPSEEFHALLKGARTSGESVSEYVRKAIIFRRGAEQAASSVNVSYTYPGMPGEVKPEEWKTWNAGATGGKLTRVS